MEDDPAARRAITLILKGKGYAVSEAASVAEALGALAGRPDWVLLDLMLPDGCGTRVLRFVADQRLPSRVCVITGCGPDRLEEARALGPQAVFKKPVDVERLLAVLAGQVA